MSEDIKITGKTLEKFPDVVKALSAVKKAYALTNARFGLLEKEKAEKVAALCDAVIANPPKELFTEIWQSDLTMLNARFNQYAQKETGVSVSDLNLFQSTPDISQTVESIVIYKRLGEALDGIAYMQKALAQKAIEFKDEIRLMRTHLQESAVSTWGQTFGGFSLAIGRACRRIACDREAFRFVTAGATLFGVSIQDESEYSKALLKTMSEIVGIELKRPGCGYEPVEKSSLLDELTGSEKLMNLTSDLKALAMINGKIGRVFVIYGSGPRAGIAEIMLPAIAPGSTIMPGKINPSMCHLVWQMSEFVTANEQMAAFSYNEVDSDLTHQMGGAFITLIESIEILGKGARLFTDKCLTGFKVKTDVNVEHVTKAYSLVKLVEAFKGKEVAEKVLARMKAEDLSCREACVKEGVYTEKEAGCLFDVKTMAQHGMDCEKIAFFLGLKK